jgi:hypothetical protein
MHANLFDLPQHSLLQPGKAFPLQEAHKPRLTSLLFSKNQLQSYEANSTQYAGIIAGHPFFECPTGGV